MPKKIKAPCLALILLLSHKRILRMLFIKEFKKKEEETKNMNILDIVLHLDLKSYVH